MTGQILAGGAALRAWENYDPHELSRELGLTQVFCPPRDCDFAFLGELKKHRAAKKLRNGEQNIPPELSQPPHNFLHPNFEQYCRRNFITVKMVHSSVMQNAAKFPTGDPAEEPSDSFLENVRKNSHDVTVKNSVTAVKSVDVVRCIKFILFKQAKMKWIDQSKRAPTNAEFNDFYGAPEVQANFEFFFQDGVAR